MNREKAREILGDNATEEQITNLLNSWHLDENEKVKELENKINSLTAENSKHSDYDEIKKQLDEINQANMTEQEKKIRSRLETAGEDVMDVRSDMENNIRDFMVNVLRKNTVEVEVKDLTYQDYHRITITITPLSPDGDGDADLLFNDYHTGGENMTINDGELSTDILEGICEMLADMPVEG
jgi:hypothetical protein